MGRMVLLAGAGLMLASAPAHASVVFFDGFETPTQNGSYSYGGVDGAGAVFTGGAGLQANGSAFGYSAAPEGVQTAHIQGTDSFTETVLGLTAGTQYTLSFFAAMRPGYALDPLTVSYTPLGDTDPVLLSISPSSTAFTQYSTTFTATSGIGAFTFAGTNSNANGDFNVGVDAVSISTGAVPELSTWAMMLLGFGGLGFLAYRRAREDSSLSALSAA